MGLVGHQKWMKALLIIRRNHVTKLKYVHASPRYHLCFIFNEMNPKPSKNIPSCSQFLGHDSSLGCCWLTRECNSDIKTANVKDRMKHPVSQVASLVTHMKNLFQYHNSKSALVNQRCELFRMRNRWSLMAIDNAKIGACVRSKLKKLSKCQYDSALTRRNVRSLESPLRKLPDMIIWRNIFDHR